jgi:hypothetical protein
MHSGFTVASNKTVTLIGFLPCESHSMLYIPAIDQAEAGM